jgi:hypothetical protein
MAGSPAVWYFLDIKPPFMGVWLMAVPASFDGLRYGLFYFRIIAGKYPDEFYIKLLHG